MMRHPGESAIQRYIDGDSSSAEARRLELHLGRCAGCRETLEDYRRLRERVGSLEDAIEPPEELWNGISARIQRVLPLSRTDAIGPPPGIRPTSSPAGAPPVTAVSRRARWRTVSSLTAIAATLILGVVFGRQLPRVSAPLVTADQTDTPAPVPEVLLATYDAAGYESAIAELERVLREASDVLQPETVRVVEENLRIIDAAIADSRAALLSDPANQQVHRSLAMNMRMKIDLLRMVTAAVTREI